MSFHRAFLVACATFLAPGMTAAAFAGCGGCGGEGSAPLVYERPAPILGGCGHACGAPLARPAAYAPAVEMAVPLAPAPLAVDHWDTNGFGGCDGLNGFFGSCGGGNCGFFGGLFGGCGRIAGCTACRGPVPYARVPSPIYVVNQGPQYSGPGLMIPLKTYSPTTGVALPGRYPYISVAGYGPHYAPRYRHPLGVRG
jgi:hypothetical protein